MPLSRSRRSAPRDRSDRCRRRHRGFRVRRHAEPSPCRCRARTARRHHDHLAPSADTLPLRSPLCDDRPEHAAGVTLMVLAIVQRGTPTPPFELAAVERLPADVTTWAVAGHRRRISGSGLLGHAVILPASACGVPGGEPCELHADSCGDHCGQPVWRCGRPLRPAIPSRQPTHFGVNAAAGAIAVATASAAVSTRLISAPWSGLRKPAATAPWIISASGV